MSLRGRLEQLRSELTRADYQAVVDAVIQCPDRGDVLPLSQQPSGSCAACERFVCIAGKGLAEMQGVTNTESCLRCRCVALGVTD